jgi:hypothetical protein
LHLVNTTGSAIPTIMATETIVLNNVTFVLHLLTLFNQAALPGARTARTLHFQPKKVTGG